MAFVDLHCHLLWELDDGPKDLSASVELLETLSSMGFSSVVATPHVRLSVFDRMKEKVQVKTEKLSREAASRGLSTRIIAGAEHYMDVEFLAMLAAGRLLPFGASNRYVLVELPVNSALVNLDEIFFKVRLKRFTPLIAHAERYSYLKIDTLERLVSHGCAVQVNLGSIAGIYSREEEKRANSILKRGLCHVLATDAHSSEEARRAVQLGVRKLEKLGGSGCVETGLITNPLRMLEGAGQETLQPIRGR